MRGARVLLGVFVLAAGCRSVLGIEALEVVDGGATEAGAEGEADSGGGKGPADAGSGVADGSAPGDGAIDDAVALKDTAAPVELPDCAPAGSNCNMCCRTALSGEQILEHYALEAGCLCGPAGLCGADCADSSFCAGVGPPPSPTSAWPACGMCVGQSLSAPECGGAVAQCKQNASCNPVIECLSTCPSN